MKHTFANFVAAVTLIAVFVITTATASVAAAQTVTPGAPAATSAPSRIAFEILEISTPEPFAELSSQTTLGDAEKARLVEKARSVSGAIVREIRRDWAADKFRDAGTAADKQNKLQTALIELDAPAFATLAPVPDLPAYPGAVLRLETMLAGDQTLEGAVHYQRDFSVAEIKTENQLSFTAPVNLKTGDAVVLNVREENRRYYYLLFSFSLKTEN